VLSVPTPLVGTQSAGEKMCTTKYEVNWSTSEATFTFYHSDSSASLFTYSDSTSLVTDSCDIRGRCPACKRGFIIGHPIYSGLFGGKPKEVVYICSVCGFYYSDSEDEKVVKEREKKFRDCFLAKEL